MDFAGMNRTHFIRYAHLSTFKGRLDPSLDSLLSKIFHISLSDYALPLESKFVSEISFECLYKFLSPVAANRLKLAEEETHYRRLLYKAESSDEVFMTM
jgi:hypothetical protein